MIGSFFFISNGEKTISLKTSGNRSNPIKLTRNKRRFIANFRILGRRRSYVIAIHGIAVTLISDFYRSDARSNSSSTIDFILVRTAFDELQRLKLGLIHVSNQSKLKLEETRIDRFIIKLDKDCSDANGRIENFPLLKKSFSFLFVFMQWLQIDGANDYVLESQFFFFFSLSQYRRYLRSSMPDITRIVFSRKKHDQNILHVFIPSIREIMLRGIRCCERSITHAKYRFGWKNSSDQSFAPSIFRYIDHV